MNKIRAFQKIFKIYHDELAIFAISTMIDEYEIQFNARERLFIVKVNSDVSFSMIYLLVGVALYYKEYSSLASINYITRMDNEDILGLRALAKIDYSLFLEFMRLQKNEITPISQRQKQIFKYFIRDEK